MSKAIDKIIELITKAWDKCEGNRLKQGLLIFLAMLAVAAVVIAIYFYWWLIVLVLAGIAYFVIDTSERKKAQELQTQRVVGCSKDTTIYTLRKGVDGLETNFGIPNTEDKGFCAIVSRQFKSGVRFFVLRYLRLPNASDLQPKGREQLRQLLNNKIQHNYAHLTYDNVMPIEVYVFDVRIEGGKLVISAIPLIDAQSRAEAEKHRRWIAKQEIIGKTEEGTAKISNDEVLTDDEL